MAAGQAAVWLTIYLAFIPGPFLFTELMGLLLGFWELSLWVSEDLLRAAGKMILWALGVFWVCICPSQSSEKLEESFLPLSSSLPPSLPASQCHMLLHRVCSPPPTSQRSLGMLEKTSGCYGFLGGRHGVEAKS